MGRQTNTRPGINLGTPWDPSPRAAPPPLPPWRALPPWSGPTSPIPPASETTRPRPIFKNLFIISSAYGYHPTLSDAGGTPIQNIWCPPPIVTIPLKFDLFENFTPFWFAKPIFYCFTICGKIIVSILTLIFYHFRKRKFWQQARSTVFCYNSNSEVLNLEVVSL